MERDKVWTKRGNNLFLGDKNDPQQKLASSIIYKLMSSDMFGFYLEPLYERFEFPYKVYGLQDNLIKRIIKSYKNTTGNMGVLLNGVKGTGKTVCCEKIANELADLDMPVIIVPQAYEGVEHFLNDLPQDACIIFDEYEKMYSDYDNSLLTVMSGVLDSGFRKVFLLTTNKSHINDNMKQRPGRIRYIKHFMDLDAETVVEIVDDLLEYKQHRQATLDFISKLSTITVDIVKAVISEVNIHNESPEEFKDVFNVETNKEMADIVEILKNGKEKPWYNNSKVVPMVADVEWVGADMRVNGRYVGDIISFDKDGSITITDTRPNAKEGATMKIKVNPLNTKHQAFIDYAF